MLNRSLGRFVAPTAPAHQAQPYLCLPPTLLCCLPTPSLSQVFEPGVPPRPESPPLCFPPTDLFPEQRIAVYRITQRQQQ